MQIFQLWFQWRQAGFCTALFQCPTAITKNIYVALGCSSSPMGPEPPPHYWAVKVPFLCWAIVWSPVLKQRLLCSLVWASLSFWWLPSLWKWAIKLALVSCSGRSGLCPLQHNCQSKHIKSALAYPGNSALGIVRIRHFTKPCLSSECVSCQHEHWLSSKYRIKWTK